MQNKAEIILNIIKNKLQKHRSTNLPRKGKRLARPRSGWSSNSGTLPWMGGMGAVEGAGGHERCLLWVAREVCAGGQPGDDVALVAPRRGPIRKSKKKWSQKRWGRGGDENHYNPVAPCMK